MKIHLMVTLTALLFVAGCSSLEEANTGLEVQKRPGFVTRTGPHLRLSGDKFRFIGTNNYYLGYKSRGMADAVLEAAAANHFTVMRMWGFLDIGNQDGSESVNGIKEGVYFQYWDAATGRPAYNDGPNGLERLDYVVYRAGQLGLKLVIPLVNNWQEFGGIDQYVRWAGGGNHDDFYTDPVIKAWYKDWASHVLNRINTYTGVAYKDDPTIMMWELANEPRCKGSGLYPPSAGCNTDTLTAWADEMSTHLKSVDSNHLVAVGDEGFYCGAGEHFTENCGEGVDTLALSALPNIDVMSLHLYPEHWGRDVAWATSWTERHIRDAQRLGKAFMLGEFGLNEGDIRNPIYKEWLEAVYSGRGQGHAGRGDGALFWLLAGDQDNGLPYPDYDGYTVYCPSPTCTLLGNYALAMAGQKTSFPPVADHDEAAVAFGERATLEPISNDVAWGDATIDPGTLDLDPSAAGRQTVLEVPGQGTFTLQPGALVRFVPAGGFSGTAIAPYTVQDSRGRTSNAAELRVTVAPDPSAPLLLYSFESGTEGWAAASWQPGAGTVTQSSNYATEGSRALKIDATGGGWFGLDFSSRDLSTKTYLKLDLKTTTAGTSHNLAIKVGNSFEWCQAGWSRVGANTTTTLTLDLSQAFACSSPERSDLRGLYLYFGPGTFYLDNIRAE